MKDQTNQNAQKIFFSIQQRFDPEKAYNTTEVTSKTLQQMNVHPREPCASLASQRLKNELKTVNLIENK